MLEIKDLCKRYADKQALDHVSLTVGPGEIVGLFGENGAGKTTLMKCILSLIRYDSGSVTLDGAAITRANIGRFSFATCEHSFFPALSAQAHREFYEEHFETFLSRRFEGLMEFFGLPMDKPIRSFSTGQKNQFEVIMALSQGADYILMDEPFAGDDVFNRAPHRGGDGVHRASRAAPRGEDRRRRADRGARRAGADADGIREADVQLSV